MIITYARRSICERCYVGDADPEVTISSLLLGLDTTSLPPASLHKVVKVYGMLKAKVRSRCKALHLRHPIRFQLESSLYATEFGIAASTRGALLEDEIMHTRSLRSTQCSAETL